MLNVDEPLKPQRHEVTKNIKNKGTKTWYISNLEPLNLVSLCLGGESDKTTKPRSHKEQKNLVSWCLGGESRLLLLDD